MIHNKMKSAFEHAQENSIMEFCNSIKNETVEISEPMDDNGSIVVPVDLLSENVKNLLTKFRHTQGRVKDSDAIQDGYHSMITSNLRNNVTKNMLELPAYIPFKDAINTIYNIYKELDGKLYGVFLVNKQRQKFNPLHPLTALELMNKSEWINGQYKIYIYPYSENKNDIEHIKEHSRVKDTKLIEANIATQIAIYEERRTLTQKITGSVNVNDMIRRFKDGNPVEFGTTNSIKMDKDSKSARPAIMIPHNILNDGITIPYYGTSIVSMSNTAGHNCSPMMSANISLDRNNFTRDESSYSSMGVCTGNLSNSRITGLRSLNHSNLLSPMNNYILQPGWRDYVDRCIDYSFMAYEPILDGYKQEFESTELAPRFESYMEEWMFNNQGTTTLDYLKHLADKNKVEIPTHTPPAPPQAPESEGIHTPVQLAVPHRNNSVFVPF